ncbi:hypothetical protein Leryth_014268 [Lithospermum erythrorhizon]|nr:hypothetical protein Leryth_014268 [Lithospermum erythrorhizon]
MGSFYQVCESQNSGSGANMHFSGYLTPCYFIPIAGRPLPVRDGDVTWMSRNGCASLVQPSSFNHYVIYEKEIIRQNMLNHQAEFTCQVHELHRLYERQNELMAEHRMRVTAAHQLQYQRSQSDRLVYPIKPEIFQNSVPPWQSLKAEDCVPSLVGERYLQRPSFALDSLQSDNNSFLTKRSPVDNEGLPPQIKKIGKRMLDLELPADLYIHSDEEDDRISGNIGDVPPSIHSLAEETPEFHLENVQPYPPDNTVSLNMDSSCRETKLCIDLNEPIQLDDESYSSSHLKSTSCSTLNVHLNPVRSQKPVNESEASNGENVLNVISPEENPVEHQPLNSGAGPDEVTSVQNSSPKRTSLGCNIFCESHDSSKTFGSSCLSCSPRIVPHSGDSDINALSSVTSQRSPHDLRDLPLAVQALPCFKTTKVTKGLKSAYASSRNHTDELMVKKTTENNADVGKGPFKVHTRLAKRMKYSHDCELLEHVDLNCLSSSFDDQPLPPCKQLSSMCDGNEVGGNTRRNLAKSTNCKQLSCSNDLNSHLDEDKRPTASSQSPTVIELLGTKDQNIEAPLSSEKSELTVGELDKIAADAICSISSSRGAIAPEPFRPLDNCLNWFAGIASSVTEDLCDEIKELSSKAADSDDLDTRKVRVRKTKDASCRAKKHNEQVATDGCLLILQGCGRKSKQPRILKKKSLKTIEMGKRTDVVAFDNIQRRKRNTGSRFAKRRPCIATTHGNDLKQLMYSSPICNAKAKNEGNYLQGWGSSTGRRKVQRARKVFDVFLQNLLH